MARRRPCCAALVAAGSPTPDGPDDFDAIRSVQWLRGPGAARHDFAIPFDRNALPVQAQTGNEIGERGAFGRVLELTVDDDLHGGVISRTRPQVYPKAAVNPE